MSCVLGRFLMEMQQELVLVDFKPEITVGTFLD